MIYNLGFIEPQISKNVFVAPNATIIVNVEIGRYTSIWFGTIIRGDNETMKIGEGTNIQDNCVLHSDPGFPLSIGKNCSIGHGAIVHGCSIGDETLVGMGATVMNGARIGKNCLIGARALVTENTIIPNNSLVVGMPSKVKGGITKEQIEGMLESAKHYKSLAKRFLKELRL